MSIRENKINTGTRRYAESHGETRSFLFKNKNIDVLMVSRFLCVWMMLFFGAIGVAQSAEDMATQSFQLANQLYERDAYEDAQSLYEQLLEQGYSAPELYLNLGHTYRQQGEIGRAIATYEKGTRFAPDDELLQTALTDLQEEQSFIPVEEIPNSVTVWGWAALGGWLIFLLLATLAVLKKIPPAIPYFFLFCVLGFFIQYARIAWFDPQPQEAVLLIDAELLASPQLTANELRALSAGQPIHLVKETQEWARVSINEFTGWVTLDSIEILE